VWTCWIGSVDGARAAVRAGADGLVAQGVEAGGHLAGTEPLDTLLPLVVDVAAGRPVLAAGGVADAADVRRLLDGGAAAAVAGTRFLLTDESRAPGVSGAGAPGRPHVAHAAVRCRLADAASRRAERCHRALVRAHRVGARLGARGRRRERAARPSAADACAGGLLARQRPGIPLFSPGLPVRGMPDELIDSCALYAGETAVRITDVLPAAEAVARLTP
jgi:nitronate monooxygenase